MTEWIRLGLLRLVTKNCNVRIKCTGMVSNIYSAAHCLIIYIIVTVVWEKVKALLSTTFSPRTFYS